jgi:hypothetical protein
MLKELEFIFNRALSLIFSRKKLLVVFTVLAFCGLLVVFCRGLAMNAGEWIAMSLTFLPVFLCAGVLLAMGVVLIRIYHDEVKRKPIGYRKVLNNSWDTMISSSYLAVPLVLIYLLLWIVLGLFFLLKEIPLIGEYISVILAFGPFLLILGSLILCSLTLLLLFFVTPAIALNATDRLKVSQIVLKRVLSNIFTNIVLALVAILPLLFAVGLLIVAAVLTGFSYLASDNTLQIVLEWFFIMLPFVAALTPVVIFFFNFAAEAHVLMQRKLRQMI